MLCSLTAERLRHSSYIPPTLDTLPATSDSGHAPRQPARHIFVEILRQTIQAIPEIYIVLDALYECKQHLELLELLTTLSGWHISHMHTLVASRKERDIEDHLRRFVTEDNTICLQSDQRNHEIHTYIQERLSNDQDLAKWRRDASVRQEIGSNLVRGARVMYVMSVPYVQPS